MRSLPSTRRMANAGMPRSLSPPELRRREHGGVAGGVVGVAAEGDPPPPGGARHGEPGVTLRADRRVRDGLPAAGPVPLEREHGALENGIDGRAERLAR